MGEKEEERITVEEKSELNRPVKLWRGGECAFGPHSADWPIKAVMRRVMEGLSLWSETEELQGAAQHRRNLFTAP